MPDKPATCEACDGVGFFISCRSDDRRYAVEKCDTCGQIEFDEDAAAIAKSAGIRCRETYPCYVEIAPHNWQEYARFSLLTPDATAEEIQNRFPALVKDNLLDSVWWTPEGADFVPQIREARKGKRKRQRSRPGGAILLNPCLYLELFHGFKEYPEDGADDWGEVGPTIGPLKYAHFVGTDELNLAFKTGREVSINISDDYIAYGGMKYYDFSLVCFSTPPEGAVTGSEFEEAPFAPPPKPGESTHGDDGQLFSVRSPGRQMVVQVRLEPAAMGFVDTEAVELALQQEARIGNLGDPREVEVSPLVSGKPDRSVVAKYNGVNCWIAYP